MKVMFAPDYASQAETSRMIAIHRSCEANSKDMGKVGCDVAPVRGVEQIVRNRCMLSPQSGDEIGL